MNLEVGCMLKKKISERIRDVNEKDLISKCINTWTEPASFYSVKDRDEKES